MISSHRIAAATIALAVSVSVSAASPALALDSHAPEGRGPYAVGYRITDLATTSVTTGMPRVLNTHIWYPAVPGTGTVQGEALRDADVLAGRWPLILFSHGSCGVPNQSPFYVEALASWGFVVAAPSHPGNTTFELDTCSDPENIAESFANRPLDIRFVTDTLIAASRGDRQSPFYLHIDPERMGVSGHSFGGQTTLRVAASDARIDGAVALAPAVGLPGVRISVPTMVIGAELDTLTPFETSSRDAFALLRGPRFLVEFLNTGHCAFAIACAETLCGAGCPPEGISLVETQQMTIRYAIPFFLQYVAGHGRFTAALLPGSEPPNASVVAAVPSVPGLGGSARPLPGLRSLH
jgi:predicted dienelactone hydrolase